MCAHPALHCNELHARRVTPQICKRFPGVSHFNCCPWSILLSANSNRSLLGGIPQKPTLTAWTSTSSYFRGSLGSCLSHGVGGPAWHQEGLGVRHAEHPQLCYQCALLLSPGSLLSERFPLDLGPHGRLGMAVQILTGRVCAQVPSRLNLSPSSLIPHPHSRDSDCPWWEKTSELS